ncbi:hypothetical protein GCM10009069_02640 [Algimonas arctica]|uniref:DUF547 domain-containing protein n=1 Tax=Algimonas arctica TaxID=1479486 RepID=A0A8J3CQ23_9PROT|nr:DUF547 domain-containing protein [Algimonas arctica]GHA82882.1 hypothetical protein GCM10009069_02640 [Algimonas arctica]
MRHTTISLSLLLALSASAPVFAQAQTVRSPAFNSSLAVTASQFDRFTPNPIRSVRLDFTIWDEMLKEMVYYTGPSLRQRASKPEPIVGSRRVFGHTSPYRLEGNKVVFEKMGPEFRQIIDDYVTDLESIGNSVGISMLPRSEQLAYWLNLHNALVIQAIASHYPIKDPSRETDPDGRSFHDIGRVTIDGVSLSLRNIREDIVYKNWNDPLVIYGFFHGDIGSPSLQRKAYTASNMQDTLRFSAEEFANSLRGVMVYGKTAHISRHYQDAAPYFFSNFDRDVRSHMIGLSNEDVKEQLLKATQPFKIASYETSVADLTNGDSDRIQLSEVNNYSETGTSGPPQVLARALSEQSEKFRRIRKRGLFGSVTIEDVQTVDDADFGKPSGPSFIQIGPLADQIPAPETGK